MSINTMQNSSVANSPGIVPKIKVIDFNFYYGSHKVLKGISLHINPKFVTSIIGPSGCGKSTLLRCMNRMNDLVLNSRPEGRILIDDQEIFEKSVDVVDLRKKVGMVFQKPNPFPKTIFENLAYGLKINGMRDKNMIAQRVEESLRDAALWDEVKDRLKDSALRLSGGQQQRLCVARTLAIEPEIILMDEPASALDPIATAKIEELIFKLKDKYTIVIVTHNMQQAARVSDMTAFLMQGELIEYGRTSDIFTKPSKKITEEYITGRFG
ncbi:MAG: phosphate ABC transporter ATP-binding protein [Candidatus Omnitrophica bacterium]|nr:phosphate ABC transporter ATP-binding protein [Candidatus Omnitrophota bacterium]